MPAMFMFFRDAFDSMPITGHRTRRRKTISPRQSPYLLMAPCVIATPHIDADVMFTRVVRGRRCLFEKSAPMCYARFEARQLPGARDRRYAALRCTRLALIAG